MEEILKRFDEKFDAQTYFDGTPSLGGCEDAKNEVRVFIQKELNQALSQQKEEITKLIKTVGATGTEEEVDKLIEMIKKIT